MRANPRTIMLCLGMLAVGCAGTDTTQAGGPTTGGSPTHVALDFHWEPGLEAAVVSTRSRTRKGTNESHSTMTSRYRLRVDADGDQLRIGFEDLTLEAAENQPATPEAMQFVGQMADLAPDYRVKKTGEFVGLHDFASYQEALNAMLSGMVADGAEEALGPLLEMLTSEAFVNTRASEQWNAIVGAWVGAELEIGEAYEAQIREPIPVIPGEHVLMNYTFEVTGWVTCERGGRTRQCAVLEMRSTADPDDMKRRSQPSLP